MSASPAADAAARMLRAAHDERRPGAPPSASLTKFTLDDAYRAQRINVSIRTHTHHDTRPPVRLAGFKSMTAGAFGDVVHVATLLTDMMVLEYAEAPADALVHPRAAGSLAFVLDTDHDGPGITAADVISATGFVAPAIELLDARIRDWEGNECDRIADNGHASLVAIGSAAASPRGLDLPLIGMVLKRNGRVAATGAGAACAGSPAAAIAAAANRLASLGVPVQAGSFVLSCPFAAPVPVAPGDALEVAFGQVGATSVRLASHLTSHGASS